MLDDDPSVTFESSTYASVDGTLQLPYLTIRAKPNV